MIIITHVTGYSPKLILQILFGIDVTKMRLNCRSIKCGGCVISYIYIHSNSENNYTDIYANSNSAKVHTKESRKNILG